MLVLVQLLYKFGYCPSWTTFNILQFFKHLGQYKNSSASTSSMVYVDGIVWFVDFTEIELYLHRGIRTNDLCIMNRPCLPILTMHLPYTDQRILAHFIRGNISLIPASYYTGSAALLPTYFKIINRFTSLFESKPASLEVHHLMK